MKNTKPPQTPKIPTTKSWLEQSILDALEQMRQSASEWRDQQNRLSELAREIQPNNQQQNENSKRLTALESNHKAMEDRLTAVEAKCEALMPALPNYERILKQFVAELKNGSA
jgi:DNA repair exonuclease SbcCD ATPase subunit